MRFTVFGVVLIMVVFSVAAVFSQEDVMVLQDPALGNRERPAVQFTHAQHAAVVACSQCHHDYDAYGNNKIKGEEDVTGQRCSECHGKVASASNRVPLLTAYHVNCKRCHERLDDVGKKSGPVMCGSCHKRK
jgi:hypothetical protein